MNGDADAVALCVGESIEFGAYPFEILPETDGPDESDSAAGIRRLANKPVEGGEDVGNASTAGDAKNVSIGCEVEGVVLAVGTLEDNRCS